MVCQLHLVVHPSHSFFRLVFPVLCSAIRHVDPSPSKNKNKKILQWRQSNNTAIVALSNFNSVSPCRKPQAPFQTCTICFRKWLMSTAAHTLECISRVIRFYIVSFASAQCLSFPATHRIYYSDSGGWKADTMKRPSHTIKIFSF